MTDEPPHDPFQPAPGGEETGQFSQRIRHEQVSARVPEEVSRGVFATGALVLNGPHEFIIDFIQSVTRPHQVVARIVLPTTIMQSMVRAMQQNFENYEKRFGPLPQLPTAYANRGGPGSPPPGVPEVPPSTSEPGLPPGPAGSGPGGEGPGPGQHGPAQAGPANAPGAAGGGISGAGEISGAPHGGGEHGGGEAAGSGPGPGPGGGGGGAAAGPPSVEDIYAQLKLPEDIAVGSYANTVMISHSPAEFCFDFITSFYPRSTVTARIFMSAAQAPRVHATLQRSFEQFKQKVMTQKKNLKKKPPPDDPSRPGHGPVGPDTPDTPDTPDAPDEPPHRG